MTKNFARWILFEESLEPIPCLLGLLSSSFILRQRIVKELRGGHNYFDAFFEFGCNFNLLEYVKCFFIVAPGGYNLVKGVSAIILVPSNPDACSVV